MTFTPPTTFAPGQSSFASNLNGTVTALAAYTDTSVAGGGGSGTGNLNGLINVKDSPYNATGNGTTDDLAAINSAITAAATDGIIYFPPGTYAISGPISPTTAKGLKFMGCGNPARYDSSIFPAGMTRIVCRTGFTGSAMFVLPADSRRMAFSNLILAGNGISTNVDGIKFPSRASAVSENGVAITWCNINGFTGNGITGRMHCTRIENCTVMRNTGWGLKPSDGATDCWFHANIWSFNQLGGALYDNTNPHGHVYHTNDRFERSGDTPGSPGSPGNSDAPGLRIERGTDMHFSGCMSDGNTGDGVLLIGTAAGAGNNLHEITFIGGSYTRDGTGARTGTNPARAGFRITSFGATDPDRIGRVSLIGVDIIYGNPDDTGGGSALGPSNAIITSNTNFVDIYGGRLLGSVAPISASGDFRFNRWIPSLDQIGFFGATPVSQKTGWGAPTGTATRTTFATGSVTLSVLAEHVKALIDDLTAYGLLSS